MGFKISGVRFQHRWNRGERGIFAAGTRFTRNDAVGVAHHGGLAGLEVSPPMRLRRDPDRWAKHGALRPLETEDNEPGIGYLSDGDEPDE